MKGRLRKLPDGWEVLYTKCVPKMMVREWNRSIALHPKDAEVQTMMGWDGKDVEFEIIDCSQMCKECGEVVERGRNCSKGCFMKSGNFILTDKLEYAKLISKPELRYKDGTPIRSYDSPKIQEMIDLIKEDVTSSEKEISDEEIRNEAIKYTATFPYWDSNRMETFNYACKWYREKLKNKI